MTDVLQASAWLRVVRGGYPGVWHIVAFRDRTGDYVGRRYVCSACAREFRLQAHGDKASFEWSETRPSDGGRFCVGLRDQRYSENVVRVEADEAHAMQAWVESMLWLGEDVR